MEPESAPKRVKWTSEPEMETESPPEATLESLPDELILKIIRMAAASDKERHWGRRCLGCQQGTCNYDHDFVANVVSEISTKFNRISRDESLWRDDKTMMV